MSTLSLERDATVVRLAARPVSSRADYDALVSAYLKLSSKPVIYVSTPVPIPKGTAAGVTTSVILPAIKHVADKYHLTVIDLYGAFDVILAS